MKIALDVAALLDGDSGLGFYVERIAAAMVSAAPEHDFLMTAAFLRGAERLERARLPRASNAARLHLAAPQRLLLPAEEATGWRWRERNLVSRGVDAYLGLGNTLPPLSRLPGVVVIHHVGGKLPPGPWARFFFEALPRRSALRADAVIAVSEHTRVQAISRWRLDPARVETILEGGPDPIFKVAGGVRPSNAQPYVLHVGALGARKNVPALMAAFARVIERDPARRLRLILAGRPGDASAQVARLAAEPPLVGRVEILGAVARERLVSLYQGAAAVVVPSRLEGFGFPVLEAMACAAPVIAAAASSLPEVAGGAARLFDPDEPGALERELIRVLDDAEVAAELRAKGPERAASFSWERSARATLAAVLRTSAAKKS